MCVLFLAYFDTAVSFSGCNRAGRIAEASAGGFNCIASGSIRIFSSKGRGKPRKYQVGQQIIRPRSEQGTP
jgi:hypothetical protein